MAPPGAQNLRENPQAEVLENLSLECRAKIAVLDTYLSRLPRFGVETLLTQDRLDRLTDARDALRTAQREIDRLLNKGGRTTDEDARKIADSFARALELFVPVARENEAIVKFELLSQKALLNLNTAKNDLIRMKDAANTKYERDQLANSIALVDEQITLLNRNLAIPPERLFEDNGRAVMSSEFQTAADLALSLANTSPDKMFEALANSLIDRHDQFANLDTATRFVDLALAQTKMEIAKIKHLKVDGVEVMIGRDSLIDSGTMMMPGFTMALGDLEAARRNLRAGDLKSAEYHFKLAQNGLGMARQNAQIVITRACEDWQKAKGQDGVDWGLVAWAVLAAASFVPAAAPVTRPLMMGLGGTQGGISVYQGIKNDDPLQVVLGAAAATFSAGRLVAGGLGSKSTMEFLKLSARSVKIAASTAKMADLGLQTTFATMGAKDAVERLNNGIERGTLTREDYFMFVMDAMGAVPLASTAARAARSTIVRPAPVVAETAPGTVRGEPGNRPLPRRKVEQPGGVRAREPEPQLYRRSRPQVSDDGMVVVNPGLVDPAASRAAPSPRTTQQMPAQPQQRTAPAERPSERLSTSQSALAEATATQRLVSQWKDRMQRLIGNIAPTDMARVEEFVTSYMKYLKNPDAMFGLDRIGRFTRVGERGFGTPEHRVVFSSPTSQGTLLISVKPNREGGEIAVQLIRAGQDASSAISSLASGASSSFATFSPASTGNLRMTGFGY